MFDQLSEKFTDAFRHVQGKAKISETNIEETLQNVKMALLEADVNFKVVKEFTSKVKEKALGEKVLRGVNPGEQFVKIVHDELTEMMGGEAVDLKWQEKELRPTMIVGLNGAGKTTFCGKLSLFLRQKEKKKVLLVPADTFRPAAKDQLETLAKSLDMDFYNSDLSRHPKDIALSAYKYAKMKGYDHMIVDTAGRLHIDDELMTQIVEVKKELADLNPRILLVADAMTGQESVNVAKTFHESLNLDGAVLSKMDSDARGGAALSIKFATGVPIVFFSNGEKMKDLELFHPDRMAKRILDMGDILTLVEKAEEVIDQDDAEKMMKKIEKNNFTLDDFIKQMNAVNKLGSMGSLLKMIPGMGQALRQAGDLSAAEDEMKKMKVMVSSMTKQERQNTKVFNRTRIERVAKGSGTTPKEVSDFLKKFDEMRGMMSNMMSMMKGGGNPLSGMMGGGQQMPQMKMKKKKKGKKKGPFGGGFF